MGYRGVEEKIVTRTKRDTFECRRRPRCFVGGCSEEQQGVVDNEKVQEEVNRVVSYPKERESFRTADSQVLLEKALGLPHTLAVSVVLDLGLATVCDPSAKCLTKAYATVLHVKCDSSLNDPCNGKSDGS
ncbi:hypothetical protein Lal_00030284, partial [Lupinus albus]